MAVGADRVGHVVVIELADPADEVAGLAKRLRHADLRGNRLPEDLPVGQDARAVGIESGEHRIAARPAQRERAVRAIEAHAAGRQLVDVRRLGQRVAVAAEQVVEIVGDQEQHVRAAGVSGRLQGE